MRLLAISYRTNSPAIASLNEYLKLFAEPFNNSLAGFHYLLLKLCCISKAVPQAFPEPQIHLDVVVLKGWATNVRQSFMSRHCRHRNSITSEDRISFSGPVNWKHSQILYAWMCITYQEQTSCLQATLPLSTARAGLATLTRYDDTFASVIRSADSQCEKACARVSLLEY